MRKLAITLLVASSMHANSTFEDLFQQCPINSSPQQQCPANTLGTFTTASSGSGYYLIGLELQSDSGYSIDCCLQSPATSLTASTQYCLNSFAGSFFNTQILARSGTPSNFNSSNNTIKISDEIGSSGSAASGVVCSGFGSSSPTCTLASGSVTLGSINPGGTLTTKCTSVGNLNPGACNYQITCGVLAPCENGGICTNIPPSSYSCACSGIYSGVNCELDIANCAPGSGGECLNGGTCTPTPAHGECTCPTCFGGAQCDQYICA